MKRFILIISLLIGFCQSMEACSTTRVIDTTICKTRRIFFDGAFRDTTGLYRDTLFNANSVGCDSIIILDLKVMSSQNTIYNTMCQGDSIYFNGAWIKFGGTYRDTLTNSKGCDSFLFLQIQQFNYGYSPLPNDRVCQNNLPYVIGDSSFYTQGLKFVNAKVKTSSGCDSYYYFNLTIDPIKTTTLNRRFCQGGFFFFKGQNRTTTGVYKDTLFTSRGCDSIVTLNLTVDSVYTTTISATICNNQFHFFNGKYINTAGLYKDTLKTVRNCDSFIHLTLNVNKTSSHSFSRKYCSNNPIFFNGAYLNAAGVYMDTLVNSVGCDSFLTMNLYKDLADIQTINKTICTNDSAWFNGAYYSTAGTYVANLKNMGGCDSIVTFNLSFHTPMANPIITASSPVLLNCTAGFISYQWYFNDNLLNKQTKTSLSVSKTGGYHVWALDTNNCSYTSIKFAYTYNSISNQGKTSIEIYPNPATDIIFIKSAANELKNASIRVFNLEGKLVENIESNNSSFVNINLTSYQKGIYFIEIESKISTLKSKFIKE